MATHTTAPPGLVIHLGNKKTGSTSLQWFLGLNEAALRARNVNFITTGRPHVAHNPLFRSLRGPSARDIWTEIAAEVAAAPDMLHVMSSELFFDTPLALSMAKHMPEELRKVTRLVVYLRRQDSYLEAMYKQLVKNGRLHATPGQFMADIGPQLANYFETLQAFERGVDHTGIAVRIFDRNRLKNGDTTADFLDIIGLSSSDPDFEQPAHTANETLSRATTLLLGALARESSMNTREIAREMLRGDEAPPRRSSDVFTKAERQHIMAAFADENAAIAGRYLPEAAQLLFSVDDLAPEAPDLYPTPGEEVALFITAQEKVSAAIGRIDARARNKLFRG